MTAEVAFAKTFLQVLDAKPIKLQSDWSANLKTLEINVPYTLPRHQHHTMRRPHSQSQPSGAPGSEPSLTVSLKSLRNPPLDLSLPAQPLSTSVLALKQRVASELGLAGAEKVRLLYKKKPCADSKSVKDVLGDEAVGAKAVELSVMVIGGLPGKGAAVETGAEGGKGEAMDVDMDSLPVAPGGESGSAVLGGEEFWVDLKGFLEQRVRDQAVAERAVGLFRGVWQEKGAAS